MLEMRSVELRNQPKLERKARSEGRGSNEFLVLENHAASILALLFDDVAEDASLLERIVVAGAAQLLLYAERKNGQRDQLRVRMLEARTGLGAVILEHQHVAKAFV